MLEHQSICRDKTGDGTMMRIIGFQGIDLVTCEWPAWDVKRKGQFLWDNLVEVPLLEQLDESARQFKAKGDWLACDMIRRARNEIEHLTETPFEARKQGFLAWLRAKLPAWRPQPAQDGHEALQAACRAKGTRYYGDGGTLSDNSYIDVETHEGRVVSVWFRCRACRSNRPMSMAGGRRSRPCTMLLESRRKLSALNSGTKPDVLKRRLFYYDVNLT